MDCSAEEQMVRMKLKDVDSIRRLDFNLSERTLIVFHSDEHTLITAKINDLQLDATLMRSEKLETDQEPVEDESQQTISLIYESYLCCKNLLSKFYLCLFEANTVCMLLHTRYSSNSTHNTSHMQFLLFSFSIFLNVFFT